MTVSQTIWKLDVDSETGKPISHPALPNDRTRYLFTFAKVSKCAYFTRIMYNNSIHKICYISDLPKWQAKCFDDGYRLVRIQKFLTDFKFFQLW